jgi:hypothetical protein
MPVTSEIGAYGEFVGEDYYYPTPSDLGLWRDAPGSPPQRVANGVNQFQVTSSLLLLNQPYGVMTRPPSIFDPATLQEISLPMTSVSSISPDGRWVAGTAIPADPAGSTDPGFVLFERATGTTQTFDLGLTSYGYIQPEWRPGSEELWTTFGESAWSLQGGATPKQIAPPPLDIQRRSDSYPTAFTSDGAYFFSSEQTPFSYDPKGPIDITSVADPSAPGTRLNPAGSGVTAFSEISPGRLLVEVWYISADRSDLLLLDLAAGTSRVIGEAGEVVAVGPKRVLARLRIAGGKGDLTLIDLDSGIRTKLAESVALVAIEQGQGTDPLAAGTHVAFVLSNPIASPYDGVWLVTLP